MLGFAVPIGDINVHSYYRPAPAIYNRAPVVEGGLLPCFGGSGTGGVESVSFFISRQGYSPYVIQKIELAAAQEKFASYSDLMQEVKAGFGRTMSHLPAIFGVSRQTLYNWLNGETPKEQHQDKLVQLAAAARAFTEAGFKPSALSLDRTLAQGRSFVELMGQGADGKETAERLLRIIQRGTVAKANLDALLEGRAPSRPDVSDMGRPTFDEAV
jgi:transcriptional regulator with XRE-family HTH domain